MTNPGLSPVASFVDVTASGRVTSATVVLVAIGLAAAMAVTIDPRDFAGHVWVQIVLWFCLLVFAMQWAIRLRDAARTGHVAAYAGSARGMVDAVSVLAAPIALGVGVAPRSAWLFGTVWLLKLVPGIPGLRQLRRVIALESRPLSSVLALFVMVLFFAAVAAHLFEREAQPVAFGSIPAALWWAVTTLTTTGYGDVVPVTPAGRMIAALVMVSGVGVFGLWTGILATGFAAETRRDNFLRTWKSVSKVPFFASLGPAAIADMTHMLRAIDLPARAMIIRKGQTGDCMYFIAHGEVEVDLPDRKIRLGEGAFFGEMALLGNNLRSANIVTTSLTQLLVLDLVDFRMLMARHPDLVQTIDAEATRRLAENK